MKPIGNVDNEIRELLKELAAAVSAVAIAISVEDANSTTPAGCEQMPMNSTELGSGLVLRIWRGAEFTDEDRAAIERSSRALRACARKHGLETVPEAIHPVVATSSRPRVLERIREYLQALVNSQRMRNAAVVHKGEFVASASPLDELLRDRLHFLTHLVAAEADKNKGKSSHAEVAGEDYFASSFYFGAYLVTFFDGPYSIDFVRHRAKHVRRELTHLLELLEDEPPDPAAIAPIPE